MARRAHTYRGEVLAGQGQHEFRVGLRRERALRLAFYSQTTAKLTSYRLISAISSSMACSAGFALWSPWSGLEMAKDSLELTEGRWTGPAGRWTGWGPPRKEKELVRDIRAAARRPLFGEAGNMEC